MALGDLFQAAKKASEPPPGAADRIRERVRDAEGHDPGVAGVLAGVGAPDPTASHRVMARLRSARRRRGPLLAAGLGFASVLMAFFASLSSSPPQALNTTLHATEGPLTLLTDTVSVAVDGNGHVRGTDIEPVITWERGRLVVYVTPNAGIRLVVDTPESRVTVLGTMFAVERDPIGTYVDVARGTVQVECRNGPTSRLTAGDDTTCWPVTPSGLLGRARTLERRDAPVAEVMASLERALILDGLPAVRGEVLAQLVRTLLQANRPADARRIARQYLDEGHLPRRDELTSFLAHSPPSGVDP
ncbi:MAG: FecR domain-containing protein [Myxococcota bacterium]